MDTLSHVLEAVGLTLAVIDFTGWSRKLEKILDRARKGFGGLLQNQRVGQIIFYFGGLVLFLALWVVYAMLWVINKPAAGTVGTLGLILAVVGFVIEFVY